MVSDNISWDDTCNDEVIGGWPGLPLRFDDLADACKRLQQAYRAWRELGINENNFFKAPDLIRDVVRYRDAEKNGSAHEAFEQIYLIYNSRVEKRISNRLRSPRFNRFHRQEAAQEVWSTIYKQVKEVETDADFEHDLYKIIMRVVRKYSRREERQHGTHPNGTHPIELDHEDATELQDGHVRTPEQTVIDQAEQVQYLQYLRALLKELEPVNRTILILSKSVLSEEEIQDLLGEEMSESCLELMNLEVFREHLKSNQQTTTRRFSRQQIVDILKDKTKIRNTNMVGVELFRARRDLRKYVAT
jgi:DNA-directed RNA polymerase specialized sigma24 family protein